MTAKVWENCSNAEYHARTDLLGASMMKTLLDSPRDFYDQFVACSRKDEPTDDMILGSVTHCLVLEPENFDKLYTVRPEGIDGRTTDGKKKLAEWRASCVGKEELTANCLAKARAMAAAVLAEPTLQELLGSCTRVVKEQALTWDEGGIACKCKPDWLLIYENDTSDLCLDLKTAANPTPKHWFAPTGFSPMHSLRYDLQSAHYSMGVEQYTEKACLSGLVVVAKDEPYDVYVLNVSSYRNVGEAWRQKAFAILRHCRETGVWRDVRQNVINQPTWDAVPAYLYPEEFHGT